MVKKVPRRIRIITVGIFPENANKKIPINRANNENKDK